MSKLKQWMNERGIDSYLALSRQSKVSELQLYRLENGLIQQINLGVLQKIADTLNISLNRLITEFLPDKNSNKTEKLTEEYHKLLEENKQLKSETIKQYQQETIKIIESLILQLPTVSYAIQKNPELPASRLIPLLQPINELLKAWKIETIGTVGEITIYNNLEHELMEEYSFSGETIKQVKIRYVGYRQEDKLLYRAKVSPV